MSEHSPLPWFADPDDRDGMEWNVHIYEATPGNRVCFMSNGPCSEANAALIVHAVNAHAELVAALEAAKAFADEDYSESNDLKHKNRVSVLCDQIDAALAKVRP